MGIHAHPALIHAGYLVFPEKYIMGMANFWLFGKKAQTAHWQWSHMLICPLSSGVTNVFFYKTKSANRKLFLSECGLRICVFLLPALQASYLALSSNLVCQSCQGLQTIVNHDVHHYCDFSLNRYAKHRKPQNFLAAWSLPPPRGGP